MNLHPNWIVGFVEGDGHFSSLSNNNVHRFVVSQHKISVPVLYALKSFFLCGHVHKAGGDMMEFSVGARIHLNNFILPFFDRCTFFTEHRFTQYLSFRSSLLSTYPSLPSSSSSCSLASSSSFMTREWLAGFIDAEGCFSVSIFPSKDVRIGYRVIPQFCIGLGRREERTIKLIHSFLGVGFVRRRKDDSWVIQVSSLRDLNHIIEVLDIREGNSCLLHTNKRLVYSKWRDIIRIMNTKGHHTEQGLEKIKVLQHSLNSLDQELKI